MVQIFGLVAQINRVEKTTPSIAGLVVNATVATVEQKPPSATIPTSAAQPIKEAAGINAAEAADDLPEISLAMYEKIDRWVAVLDRTPIMDKRATFVAAAADIYEQAQYETNLGAYQSIEDALYTLGCDYAGLGADDVDFIMVGASLINRRDDAGPVFANGHADASPQQTEPPRPLMRKMPAAETATISADDWPTIDKAAYYGLAGEIVRTLEPHTEADPVGLLIQFLAAFGNIVGNSPYYLHEADKHHANLFVLQVGDSSRARKGTSAGRVRSLCQVADHQWASERNASGLSSGEGLIASVRDKIVKWNVREEREEIIDPGISDKRLLVTEAEFAGTLSVMERSGNNLSPNLRNAWDALSLQTLTKTPLKATGAHISIIGHITQDELKLRLRRTDMANGFANRFLFSLVRRSKRLPYGGHVDNAWRNSSKNSSRRSSSRGTSVGSR
jgi:hypothetical protein